MSTRRPRPACTFLALLALVAGAAPAMAQQLASARANFAGEGGGSAAFCRTPSLAIPDNNPTGVTDTLNVAANLAIDDLDVHIRANHTWVGDLRFTLSNGTTTVTLIDRPGNPTTTFGCSGDNYDVRVDDEGPDTPIENQCNSPAPAIAGIAPGGDPPNTSLLAAYDGQSIFGDWTLTVVDNAAGDTGTLLEWCLYVIESAAPAITLAKTVGTAPGVCAAGSNLTVAPGTTVYYCYTVTNTGDATLWVHDLQDSELGTLLNDYDHELVPGAAHSVIFPAVLNVTTTNTATWYASLATGGVPATAVSTATVTVEDLPSVLEIPTLGTVGASLLGLALAGLGLGTLRRRRG